MHYNVLMKSAQLPPVRVTPSVRNQIESVLHEGETLSQFVEQAAVQAAQRRRAQQEFIARGRASLARARETGQYFAATEVLGAMQERLDAQLAVERQRTRASKRQP
ncbi:YlcI/YnfO family protein [Variovorax sp. YR216]|uniref:YlcI/YnfO family protein n=1 Tax=Variovorax sp. YR216 TaxID=1882828 RepID=UPI00210B96D2|nr:YlcI/YnfO family protein [Variovorax sp. YR216]